MEQIPLFITFSGFIIALGAVTVIDLHGLLGTRSGYWTEATIRTHKVTKPLIWIGTILAILGGFLLYKNEPFGLIQKIHTITAILLILNGCFLSFVVSPALLKRERSGLSQELLPLSLQMKIAVSFIISVTGWWSSVWFLTKFITEKI